MATSTNRVRLVLEGDKRFVKGIDAASKAIDKNTDATERAAKAASKNSGIFGRLGGILERFSGGFTDAFGGISDALKSVGGDFSGFADKIKSGIGNIDGLSKALFAIPPPALAAAAAIVGIGLAVAGIVALGARGDVFDGIESSFARITSQAGILSDELLNNLQVAADGTIRDLELMKQANFALTGASDVVAQSFGEQLPEFLEFARIQAAATGQDLTYLFESIVTGVKRSSPLILDNLGLVVSLSDVNQEYADSINVAVDALTDEQKQLALIAAIGAEAAAAIEAAGGASLSAGDKIARSQASIDNALDRLGQAVLPLYHLILDGVNLVTSAFESVATNIAPVIQFISEMIAGIIRGVIRVFQFLGGIAKVLYNIFFKPFVDVGNAILGFFGDFVVQMLIAGARLMGELANGIITGLNQYVLPAVIQVATVIADFLVGQSPPPTGPLSTIDKGGSNTLKAWVDGFAASSLQPISSVAAEVDSLMGSIATASLPQVERRLGFLDKAIAPFENRVRLLKQNFDALKEPADRALQAVNAQIEGQLQALVNGDEQAAQLVRTLDAQASSINRAVSAQETMLGNAELQLALAKSQQVAERAALELRRDQLSVNQQVAKAEEKTRKAATKAATAKEPKGGGAAATPEEASLGDVPVAIPQGDDTLSPFESFIGDLTTAFGEGIDPEQMALFQENQGLLDAQLARFEDANFADRLGDMFGDIGETFETNFVEPAQEKIDEVLDYIFDVDTEGSLAAKLSNFTTDVGTWLGDVGQAFTDAVTTPIQTALNTTAAYLTDPEFEGGFAAVLFGWTTLLPTIIGDVGVVFTDNVVTPIQTAIDDVISYLINPEHEGGFAQRLTSFFTADAETEGSLAWMLNLGMNLFRAMPDLIANALSLVGATVWTTFALPVIRLINWMIDSINNFIAGIDTVSGPLSELVRTITGNQEFTLGIQPFALLSEELPSFLSEGFAVGGFGKGLMKVGEKGPEYIFSGERLGVLPAELTRMLDVAQSVLMQPYQQRVSSPTLGGGGDSIDNSRSSSMTVNLNDRDSDAMLLQRLAVLMRTNAT